MICVSCGRNGMERMILRLPSAMSPDMGICVVCADKHKQGAARESDRILSEQKQALEVRQQPICRHCFEPVLFQVSGRFPLWCQACENERQRIATQGRKI